MKSFKNFVSESTVAIDFKEIRSLASYPEAESMPKRTKAFLDHVDKLEASLAKGVIYNVEFQDAKSSFNNYVRYIGELIERKYWERMRETKVFVHVGDLRDNEKIFKSDTSQLESWYPELMSFLKKARGIFVLLEKLKPMIQKGKRPSEPNPNVYNKPMASITATRVVSEILSNAISAIRVEITNTYKSIYTKQAEKVIELGLKSTKDIYGIKNQSQQALAYRLYETYPVFRLKSDWKEFVNKEAENIANMIAQQFVAKNTKKLSLIFQKKEALKTHKIISNRVNPNGVLENTMFFEFTDNSSFVIYSQVEYSYSKTGTPFFRIPTRFTDVKLSNGEKMKMPSEEKMDKEF